jgi:uncharacterized protein with HEPN domain
MVRKVDHAIRDILDEIGWLQDIVAGKSFDDFRSDRATRYIVQRSIEIISEASRRIPDELKALRPEIPWRAVGDIGNAIRHEYHRLADKIVWDVVQDDLPSLKAAIEAIRAAAPDAS